MKKLHYLLLIFILIVTIYFLNIFTPLNTFNKTKGELTYEKAKVLEVLEENLKEYDVVPGLYTGTQTLEVKILTGHAKGNVYQIPNYLSRIYNVYAKKGMTLIVSLDQTGSQMDPISVYAYYRAPVLYGLFAMFFLLLFLIGGMKGLKSIASLVLTFIILIGLFLPLVFRGFSPLLASIGVCILITLITLLLLNGLSVKTTSALLGTTVGLIIGGILAYISGELAHISTLNTSEAETLMNIAGDTTMKVRGLLFAGILIAALGAVMDVGMSIASTIFEIHIVNPKLSKNGLFLAGMNVGKDMMGTMSNTLILAFTGGSLNILILLYAYNMPYLQLLNIDYLACELIQGISGSIAVVLTVPITAFISSLFITYQSTFNKFINNKLINNKLINNKLINNKLINKLYK